MEGHQNSLGGGGGGVSKAKILQAKYETRLEFLGGRGSMDIFWNYTAKIIIIIIIIIITIIYQVEC